MWKKMGRWGLAIASSLMFIAPAFSARADDQQGQATQVPVKDDWITSQVKQRLSDSVPGAKDIKVDTKDDVVTLSGSTPSETARAEAVSVARAIPGVQQIKDEIKVHPGK